MKGSKMAENSGISWTHHTANLWRGCTQVAEGCRNCYAMMDVGVKLGGITWGTQAQGGKRVVGKGVWRDLRKWNRRAQHNGVRERVFVGSLMDWAEDWQGPMLNHNGSRLFRMPDGRWEPEDGEAEVVGEPLTMHDVRVRFFKLADELEWLDFLMLTKRPENIPTMVPVRSRECLRCQGDGCDPEEWLPESVNWMAPDPCRECIYRPNVWLLTSVATQADVDRNAPLLLRCRPFSPVLGLSAEPLVEGIDVSPWLGEVLPSQHCQGNWPISGLDLVICGGESDNNGQVKEPREFREAWAKALWEQTRTAAAFWFKQFGTNCPDYELTGRKGDKPESWPSVPWVCQELPEPRRALPGRPG